MSGGSFDRVVLTHLSAIERYHLAEARLNAARSDLNAAREQLAVAEENMRVAADNVRHAGYLVKVTKDTTIPA